MSGAIVGSIVAACLSGVGWLIWLLIQSKAKEEYHEMSQDDTAATEKAYKQELDIKSKPGGGDDSIIDRL